MKLILTFLFCSFVQHAFADFPLYAVYTVDGKATLIHNQQRSALSQNQLLYKSDLIDFGQQGAKVIIYNADGKYFTLQKKGKWAVELLKASAKNEHIKLTPNMIAFLWEKFMDKEKLSADALDGATGGALRGDCLTIISPIPGAKLSADTVVFSWKSVNAASYILRIFNSQNMELTSKTTTDTTIRISKDELKVLGISKKLYVNLNTTDETCPQQASRQLVYLYTTDETRNELNHLLQNRTKEPNALIQNLTTAELLAKRGWHEEALKYLERANKLL